MSQTSLSARCTLSDQPNAPSPPKGDPCPKGAVYIKTTKNGSEFALPNDSEFPIVFEGGDGDDKVTITGNGAQKIKVSGGAGNDSMTVVDPWATLMQQLGPYPIVGAFVLLLFFALIGYVAHRAFTVDIRK